MAWVAVRNAPTFVSVDIFEAGPRSGRRRRQANEPYFEFLNRVGSDFHAPIRDLLQTWLDRVPTADQSDIVGRLRSGDDEKFDSAFWELYVHQILTGYGFEVEIHPDIPGTPNHPDFLVHAETPFYLEAAIVGAPAASRKAESRLSEVEAVLDAVRVEGWTLSFTWNRIGSAPLASARLRDVLLRWVDGLDHDRVRAVLEGAWTGHSAGDGGGVASFMSDDRLPSRSYVDGDWDLDFTALPVKPGRTAALVSVRGPGRAGGVDNETRLREKLRSKAKRYGTDLPHPLVIAAMSNTEVPTRPYDVIPVLYGLHRLGPARVTDPTRLESEGHWRTRTGWRRSHNPYVVLAPDLHLHNIHTRAPWVCRTLDPDVDVALDLPWAAPLDLSVPEPLAPAHAPDLTKLGVTGDWCRGLPDIE